MLFRSESAQERYELLCSAYEEKNGILTDEEVKDLLRQVSKKEGEWWTQWSIVYRQDTQTVDYYFTGEYQEKLSYPIKAQK